MTFKCEQYSPEHTKALRRAKNYLTKQGIQLDLPMQLPANIDADLRPYRNALKRTFNVLSEIVESDIEAERESADDLLAAHDYLGWEIARVSARMDTNQEGRELIGLESATVRGATSSRRTDESWFDQKTGQAVRVYAPQDRIAVPRARINASGLANGLFDEPASTYDFADLIVGLIHGDRGNPRIKAALEESSIGAGGATVPTPLAQELIDMMRAKTRVIQAGARTVVMESQTLKIARTIQDPVAGWRNESDPVAISDAAFDQVTFVARSLAVWVVVSRELLEDSINLNQALMQAFTGAMAVQFDAACLTGSGVPPVPCGVINVPGILTSAASPLSSWDSLLDGQMALGNANAPDPTAAILTPTNYRGLVGAKDSQGRYLDPPSSVENVPMLTTTSAPSDSIVLGDFTQCLIGIRHELSIEQYNQPLANKLQVAFLAHLRADVQLAHPAAFCKLTAGAGATSKAKAA